MDLNGLCDLCAVHKSGGRGGGREGGSGQNKVRRPQKLSRDRARGSSPNLRRRSGAEFRRGLEIGILEWGHHFPVQA